MQARWSVLLLLLIVGCGKAKPLLSVVVPVPMKVEPAALASTTAANSERVYQGRTAPQWGQVLTEGEPTARDNAGRALRDLGKEGYPFLLNGMRSRSWEVRMICLRAVSKEQMAADPARTMPLLTSLVEDDNPQISRYAIVRLGWLGTTAQGTLPLLKEQLAKNAGNPARCEDILEAIIAVRGSVTLLGDLLRDSSPLVRKHAAVRLLGLAKNNYRIDGAARALADCAENDADPEIRSVANSALATIRRTGR